MVYEVSNSKISLSLKSRLPGNSEILFQAERIPQKITFGAVPLAIEKIGQQYKVTIPPFTDTQDLIIVF